MIHKHRGNRRYQTYLKAKRKADIVKQTGYWHYEHFGSLKKGKIHCSCPMCSEKTNNRFVRGAGRVSENQICHYPNGTVGSLSPMHWGVSNHRLGKKNYKHSEAKKIFSMREAVQDFDNLDEVVNL